MNETPQDALDRRIDAALARRFAPPASLATLAARARPRPRIRPLVLWLAAAAALAAIGLRVVLRRAAPVVRNGIVEVRRTVLDPLASEPSFCSLVGPLEDARGEPGRVHNPDLANLYRDMDACQRSSLAVACGENDLLAERMSATYGQELGLRPEAAGLLHGPFASADWPTGTIMTGTIVTAGSPDQTAVLVADHDTTLDCCVRMKLAESSGLHMFTWQVGEVVLTEITPLAEPRLLSFFE